MTWLESRRHTNPYDRCSGGELETRAYCSGPTGLRLKHSNNYNYEKFPNRQLLRYFALRVLRACKDRQSHLIFWVNSHGGGA